MSHLCPHCERPLPDGTLPIALSFREDVLLEALGRFTDHGTTSDVVRAAGFPRWPVSDELFKMVGRGLLLHEKRAGKDRWKLSPVVSDGVASRVWGSARGPAPSEETGTAPASLPGGDGTPRASVVPSDGVNSPRSSPRDDGVRRPGDVSSAPSEASA